MLVPLGVLALGAIFAGMIWYEPFFGDHHEVEVFFGIAAEAEHAVAAGLMIGAAYAAGETTEESNGDDDHGEAAGSGAGRDLYGPGQQRSGRCTSCAEVGQVSPFIAMLIGFLTAYQFYIRRPEWPRRLAENQQTLYQFLLNKWYFDEIYDFLFVKPAMWLGRLLWKKGDGVVIDGFLNGIAMGLVPFFTRLAGRAQSGYIFTYAFCDGDRNCLPDHLDDAVGGSEYLWTTSFPSSPSFRYRCRDYGAVSAGRR